MTDAASKGHIAIGQMHRPYYQVNLIVVKIADVKISGYHSKGTRKFPCKLHLSLRGRTGHENRQ